MKNTSVDESGKYLPIGTIVMIKDNLAMYMISGYMNDDGKGNISEYIGVPYPYGLISFNALCFFNHKDIENILYHGLKDKNYDFLNKILNSKK